jgi:hypothetical protein
MATTKLIHPQSFKGNKGYALVEWYSSSLLHPVLQLNKDHVSSLWMGGQG